MADDTKPSPSQVEGRDVKCSDGDACLDPQLCERQGYCMIDYPDGRDGGPEMRLCNDCGEEYVDVGEEECPVCGSLNTEGGH